jgi:glycosyltransferase involved in cell wall biosynthesis
MPRASFVMSVFNDAHYLGSAINSILGQSMADFELILIDDGSNAETKEILESYARKDNRIKLFTESNKGLTKSLIQACKIATSEIIIRHDSDDYSYPSRAEKLINLLESSPDCAFASSYVEVVGPEDEPLLTIKRNNDDRTTVRLVHEREGPPAHGSVAFKKNAYFLAGGYREEFYFAQDCDLWLRMARIGRIAYVPEVLYRFRWSPKSISGSNRTIQARFGELAIKCSQLRESRRDEREALSECNELRREVIRRREKGGTSFSSQSNTDYLIGSMMLLRQDPRSTDYFWRAIKVNPLNWKAWIRYAQSKMTLNRPPK